MPDTLTSDWHIHSRNSYDCRAGRLPTTMAEQFEHIRAAGVTDWGITDHLNVPCTLPDIAASRAEFDSLPASPHVHFSVEVTTISAWELAEIARGNSADSPQGIRQGGPSGAPLAIALSEEDYHRFQFDYVVGGAHWPMYVPLERDAVIRDYHRQNMFLVCHPLVKIVAHPWWWGGAWMDDDGIYRSDPWLADFRRIPQSMHDEFAAAARQHDKVVEINLGMILNSRYTETFRRQYCEYLAGLREASVALSMGTDHHAQTAPYCGDASTPDTARQAAQARYAAVMALLEPVGIRESELWRLPPRQV